MKNTGSVLLFFLIAWGCTRQSVKLPTLPITGITDTIYDNSQIWIFFRAIEDDTTAVLNRKNSISTTSWIFNIDRRLPMKLVAPHLVKLMEKREKPSMHPKDVDDLNYFSYVNTTDNLLSFVAFDTLYIRNQAVHITKPDDSTTVHIQIDRKLDRFQINGKTVDNNKITAHLNQIIARKKAELYFRFDKNITYADYLYAKAIFQAFNKEKVKLHREEYMY